MQKEPDAIHISEELLRLLLSMITLNFLSADLIGSAFTIEFCQFCNLLPIKY